jgi:four helix bundle protein
MGARDFKDLVVWQLSMELLQIVIAITDREPARSDRDYCHQVRKAARSVSSNLAAGLLVRIGTGTASLKR